jgi:hypothetical protein
MVSVVPSQVSVSQIRVCSAWIFLTMGYRWEEPMRSKSVRTASLPGNLIASQSLNWGSFHVVENAASKLFLTASLSVFQTIFCRRSWRKDERGNFKWPSRVAVSLSSCTCHSVRNEAYRPCAVGLSCSTNIDGFIGSHSLFSCRIIN